MPSVTARSHRIRRHLLRGARQQPAHHRRLSAPGRPLPAPRTPGAPAPTPQHYPRKKGRGAFKMGLVPLRFVYISLRAASTSSQRGGPVIPPPEPPFCLPLPPGSVPSLPPALSASSMERSRGGDTEAPLGAPPRGADSFGSYQGEAGGAERCPHSGAEGRRAARLEPPLRERYGPDPPPLCYWSKCAIDVPLRQSALGRPKGEGACLSDTLLPSRTLIGCGAGHAARLRGMRAAI